MFESRDTPAEGQLEFWIEIRRLPTAIASTFYRNLGIDLSVIEANASLRDLVHRNTEEQYWEYMKRLAAEEGIDPGDTKAVRRFDKMRKSRRTNIAE
ncbi:hypothetical protein HNR46_001168 [Haloferula luteola]|uniref:Uncharacterized protein n=1 Tax=Haloferula luteola TaxID=595692 RepID=A0A840V5N0_9BACT|nr:hypothetical protein [Haloferula luteola]MBB5350934.1 hypothetical protein [Haloferula luteola]